jgi:hypothetical protein
MRLVAWLAICLGAAPFRAAAVEPAREFLDALRRNGYYDEAIAYLQQQRADGRAPAAFRETIDYELGLTLLESSPALAAPERHARLRAAEQRLAAFLEEHAQHPLAAAGGNALADVLVARGRLQVEEAGAWAGGSAERRERLRAARKTFAQAEKALAQIEQRSEEQFKKLGFVDLRDLKKCQARDQLRRQILQAKLARIWARDEIAQTYEAGSPEFRESLQETARQFAELHEQQGDQLAGLYARLGEASCYRRLGEAGKAFAIFEGLLIWPDEPEAMRTMKTLAAVQALETALLPGVNKYKEAMDISRKWLQSARGGESGSEEGLAIRFLGGEAAMAYAGSLADVGPEQAKRRQQCLAAAKESYAAVAAAAGPYQQKAKIRLLEPALASATEHAPDDFAAARDRLQAAIERVSAAEVEVRLAAGKMVELRRQCQQRLEAARGEAIRYARLALRLGAAGVPADELNAVRYYLAYLCFGCGDMEEAAVLGEFLASSREDSPRAREGAKIALAAYDALFRKTPAGADRRQARQPLLRLAESVVKRWSSSREADEARMVLLEAALDDGRLDQARQYLDAIPSDSPRRGEAELGLGQALWTAYGRAVRLPAARRLAPNELQDMLARAQQLLQDGMERMREPLEARGAISGMLAAASLAMAEISLDAGRFDEAAERLEDPKQGAKTLVDIRDRAAQWGDFPAETYRVALRVYLAAGQEEAAERALLELENIVRQQSGADAAKRLIQNAVRLGRDVQDQIDAFRRQGKDDLVARWVRATEVFLTHVAAAGDQASFYRLHAVAEGFYGLGAGLETPPAAVTPQGAAGGELGAQPQAAQTYYRRAAETFQGLLQRCEGDRTFAPQPEAVTAVRVRLASCLRRLGQYAGGLELLRAVLKEHRTMVDAQVEAAYTYQDSGSKQSDGYRLAIAGDPRYPEIWGWGELARQVESSPRYREVFFTARYNLALCRFRQAQAEPRAADRAGLLAAAKEDILSFQRAQPDLDGRAPTEGWSWQDCFGELLRQIEGTLKRSK